MEFIDRTDAGLKLGRVLPHNILEGEGVVLGIARGGVLVAKPVATLLQKPLDVWVVRKIGAPNNRELGVGAISIQNVIVWDEELLEYLGLKPQDLADTVKRERLELQRRLRLYRGGGEYKELINKTVVLVDDGAATGVSVLAALAVLSKLNPKKVVVALPVCSVQAAQDIRRRLRPGLDLLVCLVESSEKAAVGRWYQNFGQVDDEEVIRALSGE